MTHHVFIFPSPRACRPLLAGFVFRPPSCVPGLSQYMPKGHLVCTRYILMSAVGSSFLCQSGLQCDWCCPVAFRLLCELVVWTLFQISRGGWKAILGPFGCNRSAEWMRQALHHIVAAALLDWFRCSGRRRLEVLGSWQGLVCSGRCA